MERRGEEERKGESTDNYFYVEKLLVRPLLGPHKVSGLNLPSEIDTWFKCTVSRNVYTCM